MSATSNKGLITFFPCSASTRPPDSGWIVNSQSAPAKEARLPFPERLAISAFTSRFSSASPHPQTAFTAAHFSPS